MPTEPPAQAGRGRSLPPPAGLAPAALQHLRWDHNYSNYFEQQQQVDRGRAVAAEAAVVPYEEEVPLQVESTKWVRRSLSRARGQSQPAEGTDPAAVARSSYPTTGGGRINTAQDIPPPPRPAAHGGALVQ